MQNERVHLSFGFCVSIALLLLVLPLPWIVSIVIAAAVHEGCHLLAIYCLGGTYSAFQLDFDAAKIQFPIMTQSREMLCALAGPLGSLGLLLFSRWFPRLTLCALAQLLFNFLPIYPLDGGRVLRCGLSFLFNPPICRRICSIIGLICKVSIVILAVFGCFWLHMGILPLLTAVVLLLRTK